MFPFYSWCLSFCSGPQECGFLCFFPLDPIKRRSPHKKGPCTQHNYGFPFGFFFRASVLQETPIPDFPSETCPPYPHPPVRAPMGSPPLPAMPAALVSEGGGRAVPLLRATLIGAAPSGRKARSALGVRFGWLRVVYLELRYTQLPPNWFGLVVWWLRGGFPFTLKSKPPIRKLVLGVPPQKRHPFIKIAVLGFIE